MTIKDPLLHFIRPKEHWADLPVCYCGKLANSVFRSTEKEQDWEREPERSRCQRCVTSHARRALLNARNTETLCVD